jgi:hypothetical protein
VHIERDGHLLSGRDLTYARARDLLFYLLTCPERTGDQIGAGLWPDASTEQLCTTFRVVLYHLADPVRYWEVICAGTLNPIRRTCYTRSTASALPSEIRARESRI